MPSVMIQHEQASRKNYDTRISWNDRYFQKIKIKIATHSAFSGAQEGNANYDSSQVLESQIGNDFTI